MEIRTLEQSSREDILEIFNDSFSDYYVPFKLSMEQLEVRLKASDVSLDISAAAFEGGRIVGFMIHGRGLHEGLKTAHNSGTGVRPGYRGQGISGKIYDFLLPELQTRGYEKLLLEVISINAPAIKVYESKGYKVHRQLDAYKGSVKVTENMPGGMELRSFQPLDWPLLQSFWDWTPSWQYSTGAVQRTLNDLYCAGVFQSGILLGYIIFDPSTKRVHQFGVRTDVRRKGVGKFLFSHIASEYGNELAVVNVEHGQEATDAFLRSLGLEQFFSQYEMTADLRAALKV